MIKIIFSWCILLAIFSVSRFFFEPTNLYEEFWWLDIPMHIIGGMAVAYAVIAIAQYMKITISLRALLASYVVIAVMWEVSEYLQGYVVYTSIIKWLDSVKDSINGAIGMAIVYFLTKHNKKV